MAKKRKSAKNNKDTAAKKFPWTYISIGVVYICIIAAQIIVKANLGSTAGLYALVSLKASLVLLSIILIAVSVKDIVKGNYKGISVVFCLIGIIFSVNAAVTAGPYLNDLTNGIQTVTTNQFQLMGKRKNVRIRFENNSGEQTVVNISREQREEIESKTNIKTENYYGEKFLNNYDKSITIEYYAITGIVNNISVNDEQ